jgi:translation initiation factor 1A
MDWVVLLYIKLILLFLTVFFKIFQNPHSYMVKTVMHGMGKRQVKNESALKEIRIPEEGELFGRVLKMLGGENVMIKCTDGLTRRGRIRGKLKRRVWIRDNDIVIIAPWDFKEDERGDIVWRFTLPQVQWLKDNNHIPKDF